MALIVEGCVLGFDDTAAIAYAGIAVKLTSCDRLSAAPGSTIETVNGANFADVPGLAVVDRSR